MRVIKLLFLFFMVFIVGCSKPSLLYGGKFKYLSESYIEFQDLKSMMFDKLYDSLDLSENMNFSLSLLKLSLFDVSNMPFSICGSDDAFSTLSLFLDHVIYSYDNNICLVAHKNNNDDVLYKASYDILSDSAKTEITENGEVLLISEYIKTKDGYAAKYVRHGEEIEVYKILFTNSYMKISVDLNATEGESIYKNISVINGKWLDKNKMYFEYKS